MRKAGSEEETKIRLETDRSRRFHKALRNHMTADQVRFLLFWSAVISGS